MKFFFPDSLDQVDPSFDFTTEIRSASRVRQRDDVYAHELFDPPPYDGLLVSKAIVDGTSSSSGKYTIAQRQRLLRDGAKRFFRLETESLSKLETMGDCGAFTYVAEERPPYSIDEVIGFYEDCGFDRGVSIDHVILGFDAGFDRSLMGADAVPADWRRRQELTIELAHEFLRAHRAGGGRFTPIGVAQGWSPLSYKVAVRSLQEMGYRIIALGGMVALKTADILSCLEAVASVREAATALHLFGVTRMESVSRFEDFGVASFDSTSPLRQAFKDAKDNYYTPSRTYSAIRVPQVQGNPKLQRSIASGKVDQGTAIRMEKRCLELLGAYDKGFAALETVLDSLGAYSELHGIGPQQLEREREVLEDQPWKSCPCAICTRVGIHVVLFRGAERNRRRGFHNTYVFYNHRLHRRKLGVSLVDSFRPQTSAE